MADIPIPFTDQEVDTDDGASSIVMTLVLVTVGFAAFAWLSDVGRAIANQANSYISSKIGVDPTTGEDADDGVPGV